MMNWLALDIGGANLKAADGLGYAESFAFALWSEPDKLVQALRTMISQAPPCDHLAITMTGELADCFESKAAGVTFILNAVMHAADARHTRVYLNDGSLVTPQIAVMQPLSAAASNWHALARFAGRFTKDQSGLLIDVGSTTCDIIPLAGVTPATAHRSDTDRLVYSELVYMGVERTPVCALVSEVPYRARVCPVAREFFATTRDAFTILGKLSESSANHDTADGTPATKVASRVRLGRMICADEEHFNDRDAAVVAEVAARAMTEELANRIQQVVSHNKMKPQICILAGHGDFVAREALQRLELDVDYLWLRKEIGEKASRSAPAHALAVLAREAAEG